MSDKISEPQSSRRTQREPKNLNVHMLKELEVVYGDKRVYEHLRSGNYLPQSEELQHLVLCGLMSFDFGHSDFEDPERGMSAKGGFTVNYLGKIFYDIVICGSDSEFSSQGNYTYHE